MTAFEQEHRRTDRQPFALTGQPALPSGNINSVAQRRAGGARRMSGNLSIGDA